jgi:hypothetical protein
MRRDVVGDTAAQLERGAAGRFRGFQTTEATFRRALHVEAPEHHLSIRGILTDFQELAGLLQGQREFATRVVELRDQRFGGGPFAQQAARAIARGP